MGNGIHKGILYITGNWLDRDILCHDPGDSHFPDVRFHKIAEKSGIPMIPLGIGECTQLYIILSPKGLFPSLYKMAEVICFIFPAFYGMSDFSPTSSV